MTTPADIMVVTPHPDDAEYGVAGTVARWTRDGRSVVYVVCTNGDKGTSDPLMKPEDLVAIREAEQRAAQLLTDESGAYRPYFEGAVQRTQDLAPTYEGMTAEQLIGAPVDTGTFDIAAAQPFLETYQQAVDPAIRELAIML